MLPSVAAAAGAPTATGARVAHIDEHYLGPAPSLLRWGSTDFTGWPYQVGTLIVAVAIITSPFWVRACGWNNAAVFAHDSFMAVLVAVLLIAFVRVLHVSYKLRQLQQTQLGLPQQEQAVPDEGEPSVSIVPTRKGPFHVVVIAMYDEPDEIILNTLQSIDSQPNADRISVVIGMEEKTSAKGQRIVAYRTALQRARSLHVYIHPCGLPGEVPGRGSNETWALRCFVHLVLPARAERTGEYCYTACDIDTIFGSGYFQMLDSKHVMFLHTRRPVLWQGFPVYHWNRSSATALANAKCVFVTLWWLGMASFFSLHGFSCLSMPLECVEKAGFKHPGYAADDAMIVLQSSIAYECATRVEVLPVHFYSTPPLGTTWWEAFGELWMQDARWHGCALEKIGFYWARYRGGVQLLAWTLKTVVIRVCVPLTGVFLVASFIAEGLWGVLRFDEAMPVWLAGFHDTFLIAHTCFLLAVVPIMHFLTWVLEQFLPASGRPVGAALGFDALLGRFVCTYIYIVCYTPPVMLHGLWRVLVFGRAALVQASARSTLTTVVEEEPYFTV